MLAGRAALADDGGASSHANIDRFRVTHVDLNLDVDFDSHVLRGSATLTVHRLDPDALHLVLDARGLTVTDVDELTDDFLGATEKLAPFWVSRPFHGGHGDSAEGGALVIDLPPSRSADETIRIEYETDPHASGLHWGPAFFYTSSEPTGARSWIPTQDTPRVRATYRAHIHTPDDDVALMSAAETVSEAGDDAPSAKRAADHWFTVTKPVPAYALDLVVGDMKFKALSKDFGVYAERKRMSAAKRELAGAVKVRAAANAWLGALPEARRDVVVMPHGFPLGAAETRRLTFVSPSLVGGGRSLVPASMRESIDADAADLIGFDAWRDRWIGEALGAYLQSRSVEAVYGAQAAAVADTLAWLDLRDALAASAPAGQVLAGAPLRRIRSEKGRLFFGYLEAGFGRARFDAFLREFIARAAGQRVTTGQFLADLQRGLLDRYPGIVTKRQIDAWVFDPGMPPNAPLPDARGPAVRGPGGGGVACGEVDGRWSRRARLVRGGVDLLLEEPARGPGKAAPRGARPGLFVEPRARRRGRGTVAAARDPERLPTGLRPPPGVSRRERADRPHRPAVRTAREVARGRGAREADVFRAAPRL